MSTQNFLEEISLGLSNVPLVLDAASVPEHSIEFMRIVSGGEPFICRDYLFYSEHDWLIGVGYPLDGPYDPSAFEASLDKAMKITKALEAWVICPFLPDALKANRLEKDVLYSLDMDSKVRPRLLNLAQRASESLRIETGRDFTPEHRELWAEFISRKDLKSRVLDLYKRTEKAMTVLDDLLLLNARDEENNLVSSLLLDFAPRKFASYILGALSRKYYQPYATDFLFREMISLAKSRNKEFIHLGLGVNQGITRFKTKWGGRVHSEFEMAGFKRPATAMGAAVLSPQIMGNKTSFLMSLPEQRKFRMLWKIEKDGKTSWIGGSAHFFRHSFRYFFKNLFKKVDTVIFEGPLDRVSMASVEQAGRIPQEGFTPLASLLNEEEIKNLERVVKGPQGFWDRFLGGHQKELPDVRYYLSRTRHWMAFYSLWSGFLRRMDWEESVDREAWELAKDMDKCVIAMETIPEQLRTLESIPVERIINFFRDCGQWKSMARRNEKAYLRGDLEGMFGTSTEFPSRTSQVIHRRDELFLERMIPHLNQGRCVVLVGTAHMFKLRGMIRNAGFKVSKAG